MSSGPKTVWRCPVCGWEFKTQITEGAEWTAGIQPLVCADPDCEGQPRIVQLDDLLLTQDTEQEDG